MNGQRTIKGIWVLVAIGGFVLWSSAFIFLYGMQGLGCALELDLVHFGPFNVLNLLLTLIFLLHLAGLGVLQWFSLTRWRQTFDPGLDAARFLAAVTCLIALTGIVATIYIGLPVLFLPPCA